MFPFLLGVDNTFPELFADFTRTQEKIKRTVLLHDSQELDNDLGGRSDQDLTLASLLGVVDGIESVVENGSANHFDGVVRRFSNRAGKRGNEVSIRNRECEMNRNRSLFPPSRRRRKEGRVQSHHSHPHGLASYEQARRAQRVPFSPCISRVNS